MSIPGFTAEVTLFKRRGLYSDQQMAVVAFRDEGRIVPAKRVQLYTPRQVRALCKKLGGTFWPAGQDSNTYGCVAGRGDDDAVGIICGGAAPGCDTF